MRAPRCHRSLKRDEEITLWRSLCALGAPLYGNLCISFSPFLSSLSLSFSFCFSLLIFLSVFLARPNGSLHSSSFFLVHLALERLFLPSPSLPLRTLLSLRSHPPRSLTHSLARSVRHTRHGISPIPSFPPRLLSPLYLVSSFYSFLSVVFLSSFHLSFSRFLSHLLSSDSFAHLYLCPSFPF